MVLKAINVNIGQKALDWEYVIDLRGKHKFLLIQSLHQVVASDEGSTDSQKHLSPVNPIVIANF